MDVTQPISAQMLEQVGEEDVDQQSFHPLQPNFEKLEFSTTQTANQRTPFYANQGGDTVSMENITLPLIPTPKLRQTVEAHYMSPQNLPSLNKRLAG